MQTLAIANHKGGVGKTATAHAIGAVLSERGHSVLMVDCDPGGSLTGACGVQDGPSLADVLGGASPGTIAMRDVLREVGPNLWLAPASIELAATALGLVSRLGREAVLGKALQSIASDFDLAIIDTAPGLGLLSINALTAADAVLIPTRAQFLALRGLGLFLDSIEQVRAELNPDLELLGVLVTFWSGRLRHSKAALAAMQEAGLPVLDVKIGQTVRIAEAANFGQSVVTYARSNPQAEAYRELGGVVGQWLTRDR